MPQPQRLGLTNVDTRYVGRHHVLQDFQHLGLSAHGQFGFHLVGLVEVVLDGALGAAGDKNHRIDTRGDRFFNRILDQGLVNDGEHFLGAGLGGRQEACAQARNRKHGFSDYFLHDPFPPFKVTLILL